MKLKEDRVVGERTEEGLVAGGPSGHKYYVIA